jgi:hypothetical protein
MTALAELLNALPTPKQEYECYSCGKDTAHGEVKTWCDQGEWFEEFFCDECIAKRRHELVVWK